MKVTLKSREWNTARDCAKIVVTAIKEREKVAAKIADLNKRLDELNHDINYQDDYVFNRLGVHIDDCVERVLITKIDKEGKESRIGVLQPTSNCNWNEQKKVYEVEIEEAVLEQITE